MHLSSVNIGISHFLLHLVARVLLLIDLKLKCCFTALCCVISCDCNASFSFSSTEKCDEALVTPLPHNAFTSSSVFTSGYAPGYAKLNKRGGTVKHFHNTCSYTYSRPPMWIAEWTDPFFPLSTQYLNKHSWAVVLWQQYITHFNFTGAQTWYSFVSFQ